MGRITHQRILLSGFGRTLAIGMLCGMLLLYPKTAPGHPHVFIIQRFTLLFDDKGLAGVKVWWKFDDMFSSMIAEDHDANRNGVLEAKEVETIHEKAFSYIAEFNYFIFIHINGKPFPVKYVRDFTAALKKGRLIYEFLIPCHVTATRNYKKIKVSGYDPSYYSAIFFAAKESASLLNAEPFDVTMDFQEDPDTTIYFDLVHPWTMFMEFRTKS